MTLFLRCTTSKRDRSLKKCVEMLVLMLSKVTTFVLEIWCKKMSIVCFVFFWATTNGVFDPNLVTEERLRSFCDRYNDSEGEVGGIRLRRTEMDFYSVMVAKKSPHS